MKLNEINALAYKMHHIKSGAHLIYLETDDQENLFSVAFKTPPTDDTGLPHILEHTVLTGSENFQLKDPFVQLLKTSVATFLNAMTYPDKTVYPCASMNEQDFFNIMRVYCDAVFFPLITEEHFQQEGFHYEFDENNPERLTVKGVVYNEMKGVYSDLNGIISREEAKSIFPDNAYGKDSGGDPEYITSLTYNDFKNFHEKYYHPSNAYFFIYGNFDINKTLHFLNNEYLSKFSKIKVDTDISEQSDFAEPYYKCIHYPITNNESKKNKTAVTVNFKTNSLTNTLETFALSIIENYLLGNASSPLRKALIDSKLGESLTSSGYGDYQRDTYFTIGLKGCKKHSEEKIRNIISDVCEQEIKNGFDKEKLEAAFHKQEFSAKEITNSYPITLMDRVFNYWIYDADPFALLNLNKHIETLKAKYSNEPGYFENILKKYILDNKHYSVLTFRPDKKYSKKAAKENNKKLEDYCSKLTEAEKTNIKEQSHKLHEFYESGDSEEAINSIPKLNIADIPKTPIQFPTNVENIEDRPFITADVFSNGINYFTTAFDLTGINEDLLYYLPIYKLAVLRMGAGKYNYLELAEKETLYTGGVSAGLYTDGSFDNPNDFLPLFKISSKATDKNFGEMLNIISDKICNCELDNRKRLKDIIIQRKSSLRSNIISSGSTYALYYANRHIDLNHSLNDRFTGISHIRFITELADNFDEKYEIIVKKLKQIQKLLKNRNRLFFSFTGSSNQRKDAIDWAKNLIRNWDSGKLQKKEYLFNKSTNNSEAICLSAQVAYNALSFPAIAASDPNASVLFFISQYLSFNYLWDEIRVKNGAYGASSFYSTLGGIFGLSTYRDPQIEKSYNTFYKSPDHIFSTMKKNQEAIEQNIIGSLKKLDKPIRPSSAVHIALNKHLRNISEEYRYDFRRRLLSVNYNKIKKVTEEIILPGIDKASICTITNKKSIESVNSGNSKYKFNIEFL